MIFQQVKITDRLAVWIISIARIAAAICLIESLARRHYYCMSWSNLNLAILSPWYFLYRLLCRWKSSWRNPKWIGKAPSDEYRIVIGISLFQKLCGVHEYTLKGNESLKYCPSSVRWCDHVLCSIHSGLDLVDAGVALPHLTFMSGNH